MSFLDPKALERLQSLQKSMQGIDWQSVSSKMKVFENYNLPPVKIPEIVNPNHASEFYERLVTMVNEFDESLSQSEEVGIRLVSFGQAVTFSVEDIGYWNPSLIRFYGRLEDGSPVQLIQHVTQISFLLMAVKRKNPDEPKQKIGFCIEQKDDETEE